MTKISSLKNILEGSVWNFGGKVFLKATGFLITILLVRLLTVNGRGILAQAMVILTFFGTLSSLGLNNGIVQFIGKNRDKPPKIRGTLYSSLIILIIVSLSVSIFLYIFSNSIANFLFNEKSLAGPIRIVSIFIPIQKATTWAVSAFRGLGKAKIPVFLKSIFRKSIYVSGLIIGYFIGFSLKQILILLGVSIVIPAIISIILLSREINLIGESELFVGDIFKYSFPLLFAGIIYFLMLRVDVIMLGNLLSSKLVGIYAGAAVPLALGLRVFQTSFGLLYLPETSKLISEKKMDEVRRNYCLTTRLITFLTIPFFLLLLLFPKEIISFLFGTGYISAANPLRILSTAFLVAAVTGRNGSNLKSFGETRFMLIASSIGLTGDIILNLLLIPIWGVEGAAIGTAFAFIIQNIIQVLRLRIKYNLSPWMKETVKPLLPTIPIVLLIYLIFRILIGTNLFFICIYFFITVGTIIFFIIKLDCILPEDRNIKAKMESLVNSIL